MDLEWLKPEWLTLGVAALLIVLAFWLLKKLIKWAIILGLIGFCIWRFWLS